MMRGGGGRGQDVRGQRNDGRGSPSPSLVSEKTLTEAEVVEKQQRDEEERKTRIQLYVFVLRYVHCTVTYTVHSVQSGIQCTVG